MTDQKENVRSDLLEAAEKRIAELEAEMKEVRLSRVRLSKCADQALAREASLKSSYDEERKALVENIRLRVRIKELESEREQALAASAVREIEMRELAAGVCDALETKSNRPARCAEEIRALPLSPDATAALNEMLAKAWAEGYDAACKDDCGANGYAPNPYRKEESNG